ncbi:MAG: hypothetical protein HY238_07895 [Acidobacteria bacterium]|nr:hypothetical protein [Acidobacteriota bacterium]
MTQGAEKVRTEELQAEFRYYEVSSDIAKYTGLLKNDWAAQGYTLTLPEMLIAATAIAHELILVTVNAKDFPMPEIRLYPLA